MSIFFSTHGLMLVFFVYGLAFLGMGLALFIESGRSPSLAEAWVLRLLGSFGLLHGIHEWIDYFILQAHSFNAPVEDWLLWLRFGLLALSFIALFLFGLQSFTLSPRKFSNITKLGLGSLVVYGLVVIADVILSSALKDIAALSLADALVRYLIGVPGAALATLALRARALQAQASGRPAIARNLLLAAAGFGFYSLTQFFVSPIDLYVARVVNAQSFLAVTHIPIQVVRTVLAVVITISMFRATQILEEERQSQLLSAQQERLEALEQIRIELTRRETMRRELLRYTVRAQEDERARVARELHDEMAQILTAFSLDLATLQRSLKKRTDADRLIQHLQELSKQLSQSMVRMVHDLRPAHLDDLGLVPALQYLIDREKNSLQVQGSLEIKGTPRRIDPLVETVLFRVTQEALSNIARHAQVSTAAVCLAYNNEQVRLEVIDEGVGFDSDENFTPPRGWGLASMRERAESVGGQFRIDSRPGRGTCVEVRVPLTVAQEEKHENSLDAGG